MYSPTKGELSGAGPGRGLMSGVGKGGGEPFPGSTPDKFGSDAFQHRSQSSALDCDSASLVGVELNPDYVAIAERRLAGAGLLA